MTIIEHYGVKERSGRYEWGSGENPYQRPYIKHPFLVELKELRAKGMSEKEIAEHFGVSTNKLRNEIAIHNRADKTALMGAVQSAINRGETISEISQRLGISETSVRNYRDEKNMAGILQLTETVNVLKDALESTPYLDVGPGIEIQMGVSDKKLKDAVEQLKQEGYHVHKIWVRRIDDPSRYTTLMTLTKEEDLQVVIQNQSQIRPIDKWSDDGGQTFNSMRKPEMVSWDRLDIVYDEDGGSLRDGLIELRRGAEDLNMGGKDYAQVRIGVGEDRYLKGMAVYSDNLPDGVDIRFHTNKSKDTPPEKVLKEMKKHEDGTINEFNPFGATIKPGRQLGALNMVTEQGDWNEWAKDLSAQMLSKQPAKLVKDRLDATYDELFSGFDELNSLTNPTVKKHLMEAYSKSLDSASRHLKAQGLPKTKGHVLLPFPDMKPGEVYAPNYENGERVVLIRYPHGGIFEIPELVVNNRGPAKKLLGNAEDAIGIHPSVASKLSGADFDGDTVWVIPNNQRQIKTSRSLKELKNFDPVAKYQDMDAVRENRDTITKEYTQNKMGEVTNLVTDMTIKNAPQSDIARAVRHTMVIIDAHKHKLDWRLSEKENGIKALREKYQSHINPVTGKESVSASTFISKKKVIKEDIVDPITGVKKVVKTNLYDKVPDLDKLSSGTDIENLYVNYAKRVISLKNKVDKVSNSIPPIKRDPAKSKQYEKEVESLNRKLTTALSNAPRERQAQLLAKKLYYEQLNATPDLSRPERKRLRAQTLTTAREKVKAKRAIIDITDREWKAIQDNAISNSKLKAILDNADMDQVKKLSMPKQSKMTAAKIARAKSLIANGYTYAEVARQLGVSDTTIRNEVLQ